MFFERFGLIRPTCATGEIVPKSRPSYHRLFPRPRDAAEKYPAPRLHSSRGKILSIRRIFRPDEGGPHAISISVRAPEIDRLPSRLQFTPCKAWQDAALTSSPHQHVGRSTNMRGSPCGARMRCRAFLPSEIPVGDRGDALPRVLAARGRPTDQTSCRAAFPRPPPATPPRHPFRHSPPTTPPRHFPLRVESIVWRGNTTPRSLERRLERARRRQPVNLVDPVDRACDHALMCPRRRRARGPVPHVSPHVVQWIPSPAPSRRGIGYGWSILVSHQLGGGRYTISFASHAEPSPLSSLSEGVAPRAK